MIDLYYDTDRSVKESLRRQKDQLAALTPSSEGSTHTYEEVVEPLDALDTTTVATPNIEVSPIDKPQVVPPNQTTNEYDQPTDVTIEDTYTEEPILESEVGVVELTTEVKEAPVSSQVPCTLQMSDAIVAPDVGGGDSCPTPALSAPPLLKDSSVIYINKKHTENTEVGGNGTSKHAIGAVRYEFNKLFPEVANNSNNWPLFGWAVGQYGADTCMDKLKLLGEYRKQHTVRKPCALFRTALVKDYQPPEYVAAKLRGDDRSRLAVERSRNRAAEWDATVSNFSYESAIASLQKLLDTLG